MDRKVLVTAGAAGIGLEIVKSFAATATSYSILPMSVDPYSNSLPAKSR